MFEQYKRIFIFDTETSGFDADVYEILELGGLILEKPEGSNKFSKITEIDTLVKNKLPILNSHIHHITAEMCQKDGITKEELFDILVNIFGNYDDTLIVAYNTPFDMKFIRAFMTSIEPGYVISNPTLDLLEVAKDRTGLRIGNKLSDMIVRYSVNEVNSHRALDDVKATLGVMRAMFKENNNLESYIKYRK